MIMPLMLCAQEYVPMTVEELEDWLRTKSLRQVYTYLVMADDWENSIPKLTMPNAYAFMDDKGDLYVTYEGSMLMTIGTMSPLEYSWTLPDLTVEGFYIEEKKPKWPWFAVGGGGIMAGLIVGLSIR